MHGCIGRKTAHPLFILTKKNDVNIHENLTPHSKSELKCSRKDMRQLSIVQKRVKNVIKVGYPPILDVARQAIKNREKFHDSDALLFLPLVVLLQIDTTESISVADDCNLLRDSIFEYVKRFEFREFNFHS